jgi:hypothetical protein
MRGLETGAEDDMTLSHTNHLTIVPGVLVVGPRAFKLRHMAWHW